MPGFKFFLLLAGVFLLILLVRWVRGVFRFHHRFGESSIEERLRRRLESRDPSPDPPP